MRRSLVCHKQKVGVIGGGEGGGGEEEEEEEVVKKERKEEKGEEEEVEVKWKKKISKKINKNCLKLKKLE